MKHLRLLLIICLFSSVQSTVAQKVNSFSALISGQSLHGFKVISVYLNDADKPMGGRFIHEATGFTLDLLQIESVPQTFIWVNTFPVSDKGEPHTQEHLLITKGNKGHELNTREGMSLAVSNAFTSQLHTAYDFYTGAGGEVFYNLFEKYLDALLYPDYTNEEVNREVRNWGVTQNADKTLRLEEKGSVYNEMSSSMNNPYAVLYDTLGRVLYGNGHPLSYNAGGLPSGIRVLNAADIAKYHDADYYLGNMGAITSLPKNMQLDDVLDRTNKILAQLNSKAPATTHPAQVLPPAHPSSKGDISLVDYPSENAEQPGTMMLLYPANLQLNTTDNILLSNFLGVFAGDAASNLYKLFVDSKTKTADLDAQAVYAYVDNSGINPVLVGIDGISANNLTKEKAAQARQLVINELKKIAAFKDNSPELAAFNKRYLNSLINAERYTAKFVNTPPKFGFRNTGDAWYSQLQELNKLSSFQKSVVFKPEFEAIKKMLSGKTNIWTAYLDKWALTTETPSIVLNKANPALLTKLEAERKARAAAEVDRLKQLYNIQDDQQAILHYKAVYDSNTVVLEKLEQAHNIKFIDNPPLTLDNELNYKQQTLPGNIKEVASVFDNMSSATTSVSLNLKNVPKDKLKYLAIFPDLLTGTGIIKNGKAISYEDMSQLQQQQILSLQSYYSTDVTTGRAELTVKGAGNNAAEAQKAVEWMNDVLKAPNWRKENLPRIRDLVQQELTQIRKTMQGAEEGWVSDPGAAWLAQDKPLLLATNSFLTRAHNIFRLKWMLTDAGNSTDRQQVNSFLSALAAANYTRPELKKLLSILSADDKINSDTPGVSKKYFDAFTQLSPKAKAVVKEAVLDLQQTLNDIPDNSLATDWAYLCKTIMNDLAQTPEKTLTQLDELRRSLLITGNTRVVVVGSAATEQKLNAGLQNVFSGFSKSVAASQNYGKAKLISERVKARMKDNAEPLFVGLINPDSQTGVFINSAPLVGYKDTARENLLQFLAAELYGGAGKQSVYTKTTGAGLSYSTGVRASAGTGRFSYYAERTPELPQTLRFVIDEIKKSPVEPAAVDYVVSLSVGAFRSANDYEQRADAMAEDIADGRTPESIRTFRSAILRLRKEPGLLEEIYKRKDQVYEKILPGYGAPAKNIKGAAYFVIGPEKQMVAYETYLKSVESNDTKLFRLYPRDFWMVE